MTGNPFDLYDVPRASLQYLDDETIYDYPLDLDIDDMEIYDYPPDATELGIISLCLEVLLLYEIQLPLRLLKIKYYIAPNLPHILITAPVLIENCAVVM